MYESSFIATSLPTLVFSNLFAISHSHLSEVLSHCGFALPFLNSKFRTWWLQSITKVSIQLCLGLYFPCKFLEQLSISLLRRAQHPWICQSLDWLALITHSFIKLQLCGKSILKALGTQWQFGKYLTSSFPGRSKVPICSVFNSPVINTPNMTDVLESLYSELGRNTWFWLLCVSVGKSESWNSALNPKVSKASLREDVFAHNSWKF